MPLTVRISRVTIRVGILPSVIVGVAEFGQGEWNQGEWNGVTSGHVGFAVVALEPIRTVLAPDELPTTSLNVGDTILDLNDNA